MYELLYIVPAPYTEKDLEGISQKIKKIISDLGGEITHEENLGGKKLAYPIKNIHRGFYLLLHFGINAEKTKELNQKLRLTPEILRCMITKAIVAKPRPERRLKRKEIEFIDIFEEELKEPTLTPVPSTAEADTNVKEGKEEKEKKEEKEPKKPKKFDLKKLGDKIDELLKI